jgi:methyl-accepting chemotaxis protein
MNETTILTVFVAVTAVAVVIQMLILAGMYLAVRKVTERVMALESKLDEQVVPLVGTVRTFVDESVPKLKTAVDNVVEASSVIRAQADKIDTTVTEITEIASTQAAHAGAVADRALRRVDSTADAVHHAVLTPVRRISALLEGVAAGIGQFAERQRARR